MGVRPRPAAPRDGAGRGAIHENGAKTAGIAGPPLVPARPAAPLHAVVGHVRRRAEPTRRRRRRTIPAPRRTPRSSMNFFANACNPSPASTRAPPNLRLHARATSSAAKSTNAAPYAVTRSRGEPEPAAPVAARLGREPARTRRRQRVSAFPKKNHGRARLPDAPEDDDTPVGETPRARLDPRPDATRATSTFRRRRRRRRRRDAPPRESRSSGVREPPPPAAACATVLRATHVTGSPPSNASGTSPTSHAARRSAIASGRRDREHVVQFAEEERARGAGRRATRLRGEHPAAAMDRGVVATGGRAARGDPDGCRSRGGCEGDEAPRGANRRRATRSATACGEGDRAAGSARAGMSRRGRRARASAEECVRAKEGRRGKGCASGEGERVAPATLAASAHATGRARALEGVATA